MRTKRTSVIRLPILSAFLLILLLVDYHEQSTTVNGFAFRFSTVMQQSPPRRLLQAVLQEPPSPSSSSSSGSSSSSKSTDDIKKDIEAMRQEALARLEALNVEIMQEVKKEKAQKSSSSSDKHKKKQSTATTTSSSSSKTSSASTLGDSLDSMEGDLTKIPLSTTTTTNKKTSDTVAGEKESSSSKTMDQDDALKQQQEIFDLNKPLARPLANLNLLDNTRWKIMFNIGREPGTWMPPTWGKSGDRLRFYAIVDFTNQPLSHQRDNDDFFEDTIAGVAASEITSTQIAAAAAAIGSSSNVASSGTKELRVVEAWLGPTYTEDYHGREQLKVSPIGAYKVVRGAGPFGTDVLRFYIETQDFIMGSNRDNSVSDVACPKGRIYGNCGYFPVHAANEVDPEQLKRNHYKDMLKKEHRITSNRLEALQREGELDSRGMFSWDAIQRMKESMSLKSRLEKLDARIQEARQRDPDRSTLRLSSKGNVGVTREGGVCCKVQKGITVEYHILGRMELGPVEIHKPEEHEDYEDLVRKQQHQQVHP